MDHLYPPELPAVPSFEAWTVAASILAHTTTLRVGHLVTSNTFRHPALLAKMATSVDVISGGRLELGLGSGSYPPEHERAGIPWPSFAKRSSELGEALEIITSMFRNETTTFKGTHFHVHDLPNRPAPAQAGGPPLHIGGAGERHTLPLVARYADVWNCPTYALADFERKWASVVDHCAAVGRDPATLRVSHEAVMALAPTRAEVDDVVKVAERRYGSPGFGLHEGGYTGTPDDLVARIQRGVDQGITTFIFFTHDRGARETLELFAREVMPAFTS
jgi:alkanesulfonate monooxygenase SsuD/methylene tetrahydromethanopterin reductase-like flavin-dependent oxidoreductase (luciferase family)